MFHCIIVYYSYIKFCWKKCDKEEILEFTVVAITSYLTRNY
jgi:hypothetical protein